MEEYHRDFQGGFGFGLDPEWTHIARVPKYSPISRGRTEMSPLQLGDPGGHRWKPLDEREREETP